VIAKLDLIAKATAAFGAGEHGDFRGFDAIWEELRAAGDTTLRGWRLALQAIRWSFDPGFCPPPSPGEARQLAKESPEIAATVARVCSVMERACIPALDATQLAIWTEVHAGLPLAGPQPGGPGTAPLPGNLNGVGARPPVDLGEGVDVSLRSARLWLRLLAGEAAGADSEAKQIFEDAARLRAPAQVIETTVLRSLSALSAGETEAAVDLARRASRMAQAESLPQLEYLANLTLARVRRYSGRPHLALHILVALSRVAPPVWSGWIAWEVILAGGRPQFARDPIEGGGSVSLAAQSGAAQSVATPIASVPRMRPAGGGSVEGGARELALPETPAAAAARALLGFLQVVRDGHREEFAEQAAALRKASACWWDLAQESETLLAAVDVAQDDAPARLAPWRRGETTAIPCGLHGIGIPQGADLETETATAFVLAGPQKSGRRILRPGLTLAPEARMLTRESAKNAAAGVRTETGIAALALAGPNGLSREDFFRTVYGFPFVPHRHQAVLDVLCHRMRNLLGDAGELRRDGADAGGGGASGPSLVLILGKPIVVPDMRCALPTSDRVLRALATLGTTSASTAAESLRMPLRTVQAVLQQLVAEGACTVERDGRRVSYRIEDTTFTEVTSAS
jgi:hypothetical protein